MAERLKAVESPDATYLGDDFPIFWKRALLSNVWDVDDNRFLDTSAGFGAALLGHSHPAVLEAIRAGSESLIHGMGDVHPTEIRLRLSEKLNDFAGTEGTRWKAVYGLNGSDAVEAAMKTCAVATGRSGLIAFEGGYHGVSIGALSVSAWPKFRQGLESVIPPVAKTFPFPVGDDKADNDSARILSEIDRFLSEDAGQRPEAEKIGGIIIEPIQGRGGTRIASPEFLAGLRQLCDRHGVLLIFDEILTGLGRTGERFAWMHEGVEPDLLLIGKGLAGGLPLSVCLGRSEILESWGPSAGEARHTSTFVGHPLACCVALEVLDQLEKEDLIHQAEIKGDRLREGLTEKLRNAARPTQVRGRGLMVGIEIFQPDAKSPDPATTGSLVLGCLRRGLIVLPSGQAGNVLSLTPALTISEEQLDFAADTIADELAKAT